MPVQTLLPLVRKPLFWLYAGGAALLLIGGCLWWTKVSTNPERVFWGMVGQSLATRAVTIDAVQDTNGSQMHQTVQYSLGGANRVHTLTAISQAGTDVKNEMIATPTADYSRYLSIKTDQKRPDGKPLNISKVVGVWAKSEKGQLFPQAVLGSALPLGGMTVPIGYLEPEARAALLRQIHEDIAYKPDFKKVKKETQGGRQVYVYDVSIQPVAYAGIIKQFAKGIGLHELDQLDPNTYRGQKPVELQFVVDVRAGRLVKVTLPAAGYSQRYTSYDMPVMVDVPAKTISTTELQKRLAEL